MIVPFKYLNRRFAMTRVVAFGFILGFSSTTICKADEPSNTKHLSSTLTRSKLAQELGMKLVWHDDFDGSNLDHSKWGVEENAFGGGNQELQIYTDRPENVRVQNGSLIIEARKDNAAVSGTSRTFSSGRVRTKHRGDWKYGLIEVRAKLPQGQGIWPAIWMLPTDNVYGGWASSGEIDIMEMRGQTPQTVLGTLHYGGTWPSNTHSGDEFTLKAGTFADQFHTFSVHWKEGQISWYIDGQRYQTQTNWNSAAAEFPAPFDQRFHLLLNLAVGGQFLGPPDESTQFPQQMKVDYVRVYQANP